jgi:DNA transformation protein
MFGGFGLYSEGTFFALIADDVTYFRVDDRTRSLYLDLGCAAFQPLPDGPPSTTYYEVPADVLEDPGELATWARAAVEAARSNPQPRRRKPR